MRIFCIVSSRLHLTDLASFPAGIVPHWLRRSTPRPSVVRGDRSTRRRTQDFTVEEGGGSQWMDAEIFVKGAEPGDRK